MNAKAIRMVPFVILLAVAGCKSQEQQAAPNTAPTVVQAATATTTPPAPDKPKLAPFAFHKLHAGMTISEVKAIFNYDHTDCAVFHGGSSKTIPYTRCDFEDDSDGVFELSFYHSKLFLISWVCVDDSQIEVVPGVGPMKSEKPTCRKMISLLNQHFGERQSDRIVRQRNWSGRVITWRSPEESGLIADGGKCVVMNYDFAPPGSDRL